LSREPVPILKPYQKKREKVVETAYIVHQEELMGLHLNWNIGIMKHYNNACLSTGRGFGELTKWFIGKINLTKHERNEKI